MYDGGMFCMHILHTYKGEFECIREVFWLIRKQYITLIIASLMLLAGCTSDDGAAAFAKSELPGGGLRIPHNERLHLSTDQRWIEEEGHLSDLIRLQWTEERAKPAIVWVDEQGRDKTAIISHDKANNPEQHDHRHLSFETTMSPDGEYANQLFTRLEIPYDTDISEIRTHSSNFNVMNGTLRISGEEGTNRDLQFGESGMENSVSPRWTVRVNNAEETGDNQGSDWQIVRYDDEGEALEAAITISRQNGNLGIANSDPQAKLDISGKSLRLRESHTPESSNAPCSQGEIAWDHDYMNVCVSEDKWKRSSLEDW